MSNRIYGLLGQTLGHSYSVPIHQALGCEGYTLLPREPEQLSALLQSSIGGLNVTIPYKKAVIPYLSALSDEARAIGSVNTIVPDGHGGLIGHNTDAYGFMWMAKRAGIAFSGKKAVILGSGGASLAVKYAAEQMDARSIVVISRSGENNYQNLALHADADIVINTTPVGMFPHEDASPVELAAFPRCCGVLDIVYNPHRTMLLLQAQARNIPHAGGLAMLVAQACRAEELFFGKPILPSEALRIETMLAAQMRNLVLIGMPGSGKSTIGALLQASTGRELVDLDAMIATAAGQTIPEIFAQGGEARFRKLEHEAVLQASQKRGAILVTGGGVVTREENRAPLCRNGRIYHIERALELLARDGRPLSQNADLQRMYQQRLPLYTAFRDAVVQNTASAAAAADAILTDLTQHACE